MSYPTMDAQAYITSAFKKIAEGIHQSFPQLPKEHGFSFTFQGGQF